jgi:hypothetical protein
VLYSCFLTSEQEKGQEWHSPILLPLEQTPPGLTKLPKLQPGSGQIRLG